MTPFRALLQDDIDGTVRRRSARRKLRLQVHGLTGSSESAKDVLILDISTTGILLQTDASLAVGTAIDLEIPEAVEVRAIVRWVSGELFGCQFNQPISTSAVSAALLRAPYELPTPSQAFARDDLGSVREFTSDVSSEGELSFAARLRIIIALALLSWGAIACVAWLVWRYFV